MAVDVTTLVTVVGKKTVGTTKVVTIDAIGSPEAGLEPPSGTEPTAEVDSLPGTTVP